MKAKENMDAVFTKSKTFSDEGRVEADQQDRCALDRSSMTLQGLRDCFAFTSILTTSFGVSEM